MAKRYSQWFLILVAVVLVFWGFLFGRFSKETEVPLIEKEEEAGSMEFTVTSEPTLSAQEDLGGGEIARRGTVSYVIDGDTVELEGGERVRYLEINTPEKGRPFSTEATEQNKKLVDGQEVGLEFDIQEKDQYGRTLAYVWRGGVMVNLEIVRLGYANVYTVPPNVKYQDQFLAAEREAREAERGLWAKTETTEGTIEIVNINADAPGSDNENKNGEWVEIGNRGESTISMVGWTLKDEGNHFYTFGDFSLAPGASVFVYSGAGVDSEAELYWDNPETAIWNNSGDTAFLRDASGNLVDSYKY